jgi:hypothetical protein
MNYFLRDVPPPTYVFEGVDMLCLFLIGLLRWVENTFVSLKETIYVRTCTIHHIISPWEFSSFWQECFLHIRVFKLAKGSLSSKQVYSVSLQKHMYLSKEIHLLEAGVSSTLIHCVDWVSYWKEYLLYLRLYKTEINSFFWNRPIQLSWGNNVYLSKENLLYYRQENLAHLFPLRIGLVFAMKTSCNVGFARCR